MFVLPIPRIHWTHEDYFSGIMTLYAANFGRKYDLSCETRTGSRVPHIIKSSWTYKFRFCMNNGPLEWTSKSKWVCRGESTQAVERSVRSCGYHGSVGSGWCRRQNLFGYQYSVSKDRQVGGGKHNPRCIFNSKDLINGSAYSLRLFLSPEAEIVGITVCLVRVSFSSRSFGFKVRSNLCDVSNCRIGKFAR